MLSTIKGLKINVSVNVEIGEISENHSHKHHETKDFASGVKAGVNFDMSIDECQEEVTAEEVGELFKMLGTAVSSELHNQVEQHKTEACTTEPEKASEVKSGFHDVAGIIKDIVSENPEVTPEELCENKLLQQYAEAMGIKIIPDDIAEQIKSNAEPWDNEL